MVVCGSKTDTTLGKNDFEHILLNFSPISKNRSKQKHETDDQIDLLIATDCISEGQNLEILQLICRNEKEVFNALCDLFNSETQDGKDMKVYENLLSRASDEVVRMFKKQFTKMFKKREAFRLTQSRDAVIVKKANNLRDFNLVSWFVIK